MVDSNITPDIITIVNTLRVKLLIKRFWRCKVYMKEFSTLECLINFSHLLTTAGVQSVDDVDCKLLRCLWIIADTIHHEVVVQNVLTLSDGCREKRLSKLVSRRKRKGKKLSGILFSTQS